MAAECSSVKKPKTPDNDTDSIEESAQEETLEKKQTKQKLNAASVEFEGVSRSEKGGDKKPEKHRVSKSEETGYQNSKKTDSKTSDNVTKSKNSGETIGGRRLTDQISWTWTQAFWKRVVDFNRHLFQSDRTIFIMQFSIAIACATSIAMYTGYWLGKNPIVEDLVFCTAEHFDKEKCTLRVGEEEGTIQIITNTGPPKEEFEKLKQDVTNQSQYLDQCLLENNDLKTKQDSLEKKLFDTTKDVSKVNHLFGLLNNNALDKESGIVVVLCLLVGEVLIGMTLACYILPQLRRQSGGYFGTGSQNPEMSENTKSILNQVNNRQQLQPQICVISFFETNQTEHQRLLRSVLAGSQNEGLTIKPFLVTRHTNIQHIPPCKMYMIFVDFNERHIILEPPGRGLGDLKLTTVRAAMKMRGEIVIVYDAKSNGDQNGRLYDKELTSIQRIDELKMLDSKKCVLSINRKFSDFQKNHLQGKISSTFG
ncbi:hypothetical protein ScPMuIL_002614 [Solemya velum]